MPEATASHTDTTDAGVPRPFDPEAVIAELHASFERLPEAAMRQAREHRDVMVPRLIQTIREATAVVRQGNKVDGNAHFFALFMLTEFRAKEALPTILEAISLPDEGPFDLFEDAITSSLAGILVALADDPFPLLDALISNRDLNEYVRWEAAQAYVHLVKNGHLTRVQAIERLAQHLRRQVEGNDSVIVTGLICTLADLAPKEAYEQIKDAFSRGMVDESMIRLKDIDRDIAEGEHGVQSRLDRLNVFDDAIEELRHWACFQPERPAKPAREPVSWPIHRGVSRDVQSGSARPPAQPPSQLAPAPGKRVGRNDPCPCGSGKKYKKCCIDKDRNT